MGRTTATYLRRIPVLLSVPALHIQLYSCISTRSSKKETIPNIKHNNWYVYTHGLLPVSDCRKPYSDLRCSMSGGWQYGPHSGHPTPQPTGMSSVPERHIYFCIPCDARYDRGGPSDTIRPKRSIFLNDRAPYPKLVGLTFVCCNVFYCFLRPWYC